MENLCVKYAHSGVLVGVCTQEDLFLCIDHGFVKKIHKVDVLRGKNGVVFRCVGFIIALVWV